MLVCDIYNKSEQRYVCEEEVGWCSCVPTYDVALDLWL